MADGPVQTVGQCSAVGVHVAVLAEPEVEDTSVGLAEEMEKVCGHAAVLPPRPLHSERLFLRVARRATMVLDEPGQRRYNPRRWLSCSIHAPRGALSTNESARVKYACAGR